MSPFTQSLRIGKTNHSGRSQNTYVRITASIGKKSMREPSGVVEMGSSTWIGKKKPNI